MSVNAWLGLLKLRLGLITEPEPASRLIGLFAAKENLTVVPSIVGIKNNFRVENYGAAVQLELTASDSQLGAAVAEALAKCTVDRKLTWWSIKSVYLSDELKALTGCKNARAFHKHVKYVQINEADGAVVFSATVAGEGFTYTPKFNASLNDQDELGHAARLAIAASK